MEWFRTYHSILDKPKFARLSLEAIGAWTLISAAAGRATPRGSLPSDVEELALILHRPADVVAEMVEVLLDVGLLERRADGVVWLYKWEMYQPPSTERAAKSRQAATSRNTRQRPATIDNPRGEEKRGDKTPQPPEGGPGGGLEPFESPPDRVPLPALSEADRIAKRAEELCSGLGSHARRWCDEFKPAWVAEAVAMAADKGVASPVWVGRVLQRFKAQGASDSERFGRRPASMPEKPRPEDRPAREIRLEHEARAAAAAAKRAKGGAA